MSHIRWTEEQLREIAAQENASLSLGYERTLDVANEIFTDRYGKATRGQSLKDFPVNYREEFIRAAEASARKIATTPAKDKIRSLLDLHLEARMLRAKGKKIVLAHGCYDWFHLGHLRHLEEARLQGDALFVTVTGDAYVRKGPERPIFKAIQRAEMLAAIHCVDWVAVNEAETAVPVIDLIRPDIFAKGQEYAGAEDEASIAEFEAIKRLHGRMHYTDQIVYSSSKLIRMTRGEKL